MEYFRLDPSKARIALARQYTPVVTKTEVARIFIQ